MDLKKILGAIAPTLATALLGPVGGLAVEVLGNALGIDQPTQDKIQDAFKTGQMTGDQIVAVKQAENAFLLRCKELDIDLERIHAGDRDSARKREVETKDWTPRILAGVIVVTWGLVQWHLLTNVIHDDMRELVMRVLGTLDAALMLVLSYYYGASNQPGTVINGGDRRK